MKRLFCSFLLTLTSFFIVWQPTQAAESSSPYDTVLEGAKDTNGAVDAILDAGKDIDKSTAGKLVDYLKNSSLWKKLSEGSQSWLTNNFSKIGPWVKNIGWVLNAIDLAPSLYNTVTSYMARDKEKFKAAFRDSTLKTVSILTGLAIGAGVSAALPLVVAGTAATGGALLVVAAGGVIVSVGAGKLVDSVVKNLFSKSIEDFAGGLYDKLVGDDTLSQLQPSGAGSGGGSGLTPLRW